ncbi:YdeI/OmpD-associated family protein [Frateuria terrea]|uniref:YdeI/OmpD-associated family protein n=1 Tax=Frateuria terrea TaxID=529704 RepID=UPI001C31E458|nr:YdeI/OmpD-associated family protein [Frateuria terrea]
MAPTFHAQDRQEPLVQDQHGQGRSPDRGGTDAPCGAPRDRPGQAGRALGSGVLVRSRSTVPDDFQQALDANAKAKAFFATLDSQNRFSVLYRIQNVKKADTRARKIAQFVEMLGRGQKLRG